MRKLVLLLILASVAASSFAQTYKWRDASGRIQYSDIPPPAGAKDVQQIRKSSGIPSGPSGSGASKSVSDQDADFRKRLADKQEAETKQNKATEEERVRAHNCDLAKGQLAALESGARLMQLNAQGERVALDDAGRERAKQEAQQAVESWCKK
jgi:hypothetical protein